jgi:hypothetical protein
MSAIKDDDVFSEKEAARRRDEVIRRMANTPPQPKLSPRPKRKRKAVADRAAGKARARREA